MMFCTRFIINQLQKAVKHFYYGYQEIIWLNFIQREPLCIPSTYLSDCDLASCWTITCLGYIHAACFTTVQEGLLGSAIMEVTYQMQDSQLVNIIMYTFQGKKISHSVVGVHDQRWVFTFKHSWKYITVLQPSPEHSCLFKNPCSKDPLMLKDKDNPLRSITLCWGCPSYFHIVSSSSFLPFPIFFHNRRPYSIFATTLSFDV